MADYWMTSGKRRLQERQNKSFAKRAQSRAQLVATTTHEVDLRPPQQASTTQTANHPRRHRRSKIHGGYSTYADPIARRGVAVSLRRSPLQPSPSNVQHQQPQATTGTARFRRLRNASHPQISAPFNGHSSAPFGQDRVSAVPASQRQTLPHRAGKPPPPFGGQPPLTRGATNHEQRYYESQSQPPYTTHQEMPLQDYAFEQEAFVERQENYAPDFLYEPSMDTRGMDLGYVPQEQYGDLQPRGRNNENSFEVHWGQPPQPERQVERSFEANWGSDNILYSNTNTVHTQSNFSGTLGQETAGIQRFRTRPSQQLEVNGLVRPGELHAPPFAGVSGPQEITAPRSYGVEQFRLHAFDSAVKLEPRDGHDLFELPSEEPQQSLLHAPLNVLQPHVQPPFAGARKRKAVDSFLQAEFRQDDAVFPLRRGEEEAVREGMEFDLSEARDDLEFNQLCPVYRQNNGIARFQQRPARRQASLKVTESSGLLSNQAKQPASFRPQPRPQEQEQHKGVRNKDPAREISSKLADLQTWKSRQSKRDLRPKTAPARTLDQSPEVSTGHLGDLVARKKETANQADKKAELKQGDIKKPTENSDMRADTAESSKVAANPYKPKLQDKAASSQSEESLHYPCERHPSYDAPDFFRFFNGGVEVNIRGQRLPQPHASPVRMESMERGGAVQTPESDTLSDLDFDGKTSLWGTSVKKQK